MQFEEVERPPLGSRTERPRRYDPGQPRTRGPKSSPFDRHIQTHDVDPRELQAEL